ncbi:acyl carrier protein [Saccharobesus litoralis]|uniref:Acyl carrier protein n=1 Tax=Saccharobesus litoralis TaxID=2172099 RepID=A0A2S0VUL7_9ALTE|nr:acyl carrier protein [Saccharobesus litoralis]AWB67790.1 acyl carrier protein [Saccharobesus litoralis]
MAIEIKQLQQLIYRSIDELNAVRDGTLIEKSEQTALYGQNSSLDSVDLVNLLLSVEELLEDEFDIEFTIANEKAMSLKNSPFKTVSTLSQYLAEELGG